MGSDLTPPISAVDRKYKTLYVKKLSAAMNVAPETASLSTFFPEPNYQSLRRSGMDSWSVAFVRAGRDLIGARPRNDFEKWARQAVKIRQLCFEMLDGALGKETAAGGLMRPGRTTSRWFGRIALYQSMGHERSMRSVDLRCEKYQTFRGETFSPPRSIWTLTCKKEGIFLHDESLSDLVYAYGLVHSPNSIDVTSSKQDLDFG